MGPRDSFEQPFEVSRPGSMQTLHIHFRVKGFFQVAQIHNVQIMLFELQMYACYQILDRKSLGILEIKVL